MRGTARQLVRYVAVGGIGFAVDAGALALLLGTGAAGPYLGRVVSYLVAATVTWLLHRRFTFPGAERSRRGRQWLLFIVVNTLGAALNYGVYAALVAGTATVAREPVLGVAAGSVIALAFNFLANRAWVFRAARP